MSEKNLLDEVFNTPEEDVSTFADVLKENQVGLDWGEKDAEAFRVEAPQLVAQISGLIQITHGWDKDTFVLHIEPYHPRRPWAVSENRVMFAIARTMNKYIPSEVKVDMYPPMQDWEIKAYTFKAIDLKKAWNFQESDTEKIVHDLFEVLNALV